TADSPGKTRKGRKVLTSSPEKKLNDQQPLDSGKPDLSLGERMVKQLKKVYLMVKVSLAYNLIKIVSRLDDLLVRKFVAAHDKGRQTADKQDSKVSYHAGDESVIKAESARPRNPSFESRQTLLGPVIAENTEDLLGVTYPGGIPPHEKQYYKKPRLVVLKDGATNRYGHALLAFGDPAVGDDRYVQISSANWYPEHLNDRQMMDYLEKWGNQVAFEINLDCEDTEGMFSKLDQLSKNKWLWGGPLHNCMSFCKEVAKAGGSNSEFFTDYATLSNRLLNGLSNGILQGVSVAAREMTDRHPDFRWRIADVEEAIRYCGLDEISEPTPSAYMQEAIDRMARILTSSRLSGSMAMEMESLLKRHCGNSAWSELERADQQYLANSNHLLADLPLAGAYNLPVGKRRVGPQTMQGFNEGNDEL
ncbi:MAG: hypothetical protein ACR2PT_04445, partial [Endozoicomonas sp.]